MSDDESYPGSKAGSGVYQKIISLMPAHRDYFELFLGHGKILRTKRPAPGRNIGVDSDPAVIQWWRRRRPTSPPATILQADALHLILSEPAMMDPQTLVYLDPPYLLSTRSRKRYAHEFCTETNHRDLIARARRCRCMMMISGYSSPLYTNLLADWRHVSFNARTRGRDRREFVWMNFPAGLPLHDVAWVGTDFRERERIKRKRQRWVSRFTAMPAAERQVIREALDQVQQGDRPSPKTTMRTLAASPAMTMASTIAGNDDAAGKPFALQPYQKAILRSDDAELTDLEELELADHEI